MEEKVSLVEILAKMKKKWYLFVVLIVVGAVLFNLYDYNKAKQVNDSAQSLHARYAAAAPELPGYYTEDLYALRETLSESEIAFVLAYAQVYYDFVSKYGVEVPEETDEDLTAYMVLVSSLKDVKSMMSSNQRQFYDKIKKYDRSKYVGTTAVVNDYVPVQPQTFQVKSTMLGSAIGFFAALFCVVVPVLLRKKS